MGYNKKVAFFETLYLFGNVYPTLLKFINFFLLSYSFILFFRPTVPPSATNKKLTPLLILLLLLARSSVVSLRECFAFIRRKRALSFGSCPLVLSWATWHVGPKNQPNQSPLPLRYAWLWCDQIWGKRISRKQKFTVICSCTPDFNSILCLKMTRDLENVGGGGNGKTFLCYFKST